jgi:hypothetical protein
LSGKRVELVARGGFFGGPINTISEINSIYYDLLRLTLEKKLMGTEESIFSIMLYRNKELIDYFEIECNGLMNTFFENLKNNELTLKTHRNSNANANANANVNVNVNAPNIDKTSLYVIGFNQFDVAV